KTKKALPAINRALPGEGKQCSFELFADQPTATKGTPRRVTAWKTAYRDERRADPASSALSSERRGSGSSFREASRRGRCRSASERGRCLACRRRPVRCHRRRGRESARR